MPATYIFLFHRLGVGVPEAVGLEGLIVVTDLVFYVTVMPLAALILLFEVGAKPNVLHLVVVVMLVVVGAARSSGTSGATIAASASASAARWARCPGWPGTVTAWPGPRSSLCGACVSYRKCPGPSMWPSFWSLWAIGCRATCY